MKKFISGIIVGALVCSSATMALASSGSQSILATYRNIKVAVGNATVQLTDANGNTVEPFIYNGTVYLPVRAVSQALGKQVRWENATSTVYIGDAAQSTQQTTTTATPVASTSTPAGTVLYNKNGVKVTYLGHKRESGDFANDEYEFKVENSTGTAWSVYSEEEKVDNVSASLGLLATAQPESVAYEKITLYDEVMQECYHLSSHNSISFKLRVWDDDNSFTTDRITIIK